MAFSIIYQLGASHTHFQKIFKPICTILDFPVLYWILPYCLVNIQPQAGKDDFRGEGCSAGGAMIIWVSGEGGCEKRGLYTVLLFVKLPLPVPSPLPQCVRQGSEYLTLHLKETYSTSGDISDIYFFDMSTSTVTFKYNGLYAQI